VRLDVKLKELSNSDSPMPPEVRESSRPPAARRASKPHHATSPQPTLDAVERIFARASITGIQPSEPPLSRPEAPPRRASTPPPRPVTDPGLYSRTPTQPGVQGRPATEPRPVERPKTNPSPLSDSTRRGSGLYRLTGEPGEESDDAPPGKKVP
jgi:hypothetical protein